MWPPRGSRCSFSCKPIRSPLPPRQEFISPGPVRIRRPSGLIGIASISCGVNGFSPARSASSHLQGSAQPRALLGHGVGGCSVLELPAHVINDWQSSRDCDRPSRPLIDDDFIGTQLFSQCNHFGFAKIKQGKQVSRYLTDRLDIDPRGSTNRVRPWTFRHFRHFPPNRLRQGQLLDNALQQHKLANTSKSDQRGRVTDNHLLDLPVEPQQFPLVRPQPRGRTPVRRTWSEYRGKLDETSPLTEPLGQEKVAESGSSG